MKTFQAISMIPMLTLGISISFPQQEEEEQPQLSLRCRS